MNHEERASSRPRRDLIVARAAELVRTRWKGTPRVGLILGTGLGGLAHEIQTAAAIPYSELPEFPCSTAVGHAGRLVCGTLQSVPVVAMEGRCHLYEGYSPEQITLAVRLMHALGADTLIASNATGGLNPRLATGDLVVVSSHINAMGLRSQFPGAPMSHPRVPLGAASNRPSGSTRTNAPYDDALAEQALAVARHGDFVAIRGVYVGMLGPNYETRAEYRYLRRIGGDVVGMSTIPEVQIAHELGMRVLVLSVVTNVARPDVAVHTTAGEVVSAAEAAAARVCQVVRAVVTHLGHAIA